MAQESPSPRELIGLGASIVGLVVFGLVIGWFVDHSLGTSPVFILVGLAIGVISAVIRSIAQFRKFLRD